MSVWAQGWAYEQIAGGPGAKAVLVSLANFADEHGECFPSQETIARMTEQGVRTVRRHLADLEAKGLILRKKRRAKSGRRTSDVFQLQAPAERLRPGAGSVGQTNSESPSKPGRDGRPNRPVGDGKTDREPAAKLANNQRPNWPTTSGQIGRETVTKREPSTSRRLEHGGDEIDNFDDEIAWLVKATGRKPESLRRLLGKWCRQHPPDLVAATIEEAKAAGATSPIGWVVTVLKRGNTTRGGVRNADDGSDDSPSMKAYLRAYTEWHEGGSNGPAPKLHEFEEHPP